MNCEMLTMSFLFQQRQEQNPKPVKPKSVTNKNKQQKLTAEVKNTPIDM